MFTESHNSGEARVAEVMNQLLQQVRDRSDRLSSEAPSEGMVNYDFNLSELRRSLDEINDSWHVSAHLPMMWQTPIVGRVGSYVKRVVRILLRWYINPIVEQQNTFNAAVSRTIFQMVAYQDRLNRECQRLEDRLAHFERQDHK